MRLRAYLTGKLNRMDVKSGCMTAISHHYSPQVYLRRFVAPKSKKELWEYDLATGIAKLSSPKKSGCENYYNSVALEDGTRDDETMEKAFHPLENALPKLFEAIRNRRMTDELWDLFFAFAAIHETRVPSRVRAIHDFVSTIAQMRFEMSCQSSSSFQKKLAATGVEPHEALTTIEMHAGQGAALLLSLEGIKALAKIFAQLNWSFLYAPNGKFFITSDNPICRWLPSETKSIDSGGLADADDEIFFPLSRRICAFVQGTTVCPKMFNEIEPDVVDTLNRRTVRNARQFVYGPTNDIQIRELVDKAAKARQDSCSPTETN